MALNFLGFAGIRVPLGDLRPFADRHGSLVAALRRVVAHALIVASGILVAGLAQAQIRVESERYLESRSRSTSASPRVLDVVPSARVVLPAVSAAERELRLGALAQRPARYRSIDIVSVAS